VHNVNTPELPFCAPEEPSALSHLRERGSSLRWNFGRFAPSLVMGWQEPIGNGHQSQPTKLNFMAAASFTHLMSASANTHMTHPRTWRHMRPIPSSHATLGSRFEASTA
jgi:hypothetical protein